MKKWTVQASNNHQDHKNALILNGDRRRVPISCIVCLNRGLQNTVQPLSIFDGTIRLMQRIFAPVWPGELQNQAFNYCEELSSEIPVLDFYCKPDLE